MARLVVIGASVAFVLLGFTQTTQAGIWREHNDGHGDSGSLLATAQRTMTVTPGDVTLTAIYGNLANSPNIDLYLIYITNPAAFSATVIGSAIDSAASANNLLQDSQLFLFDSTGKGVLSNDDQTDTNLLSKLPTGSLTLGLGLYYLAISGYNTDPRDTNGNFIFPDQSLNMPNTDIRMPVPGSTTLASWNPNSRSGASTGGYGILLTGTAYSDFVPPVSSVPVPGNLVLMGMATVSFGAYRWRRSKKC